MCVCGGHNGPLCVLKSLSRLGSGLPLPLPTPPPSPQPGWNRERASGHWDVVDRGLSKSSGLVTGLWPQLGHKPAVSVLGKSYNCPKPQFTHLSRPLPCLPHSVVWCCDRAWDTIKGHTRGRADCFCFFCYSVARPRLPNKASLWGAGVGGIKDYPHEAMERPEDRNQDSNSQSIQPTTFVHLPFVERTNIFRAPSQ